MKCLYTSLFPTLNLDDFGKLGGNPILIRSGGLPRSSVGHRTSWCGGLPALNSFGSVVVSLFVLWHVK